MLKRILKITAIVLVLAFVIIQFFRPNYVNPPIVQAETLDASTQVPDNVKSILNRSCADCHSHQTAYPWYSNVAPVSWLLADDIRDGRNQVNFSVWNTYPTRKKIRKLDEICEQVESAEMPLPAYLWIHRDAALKDGEAAILCDWANSEKARLEQQQTAQQ
jgi:hypothetical protein